MGLGRGWANFELQSDVAALLNTALPPIPQGEQAKILNSQGGAVNWLDPVATLTQCPNINWSLWYQGNALQIPPPTTCGGSYCLSVTWFDSNGGPQRVDHNEP